MAALDYTWERREKLIARDNRKEGKLEGLREGKAKGEAKGEQKTELRLIKKLIQNMGVSAEQAMDILDIAKEKREKYLKKLL